MKRYLFALLIVAGVTAPLIAQVQQDPNNIQIQEHSQKSIYRSVLEWLMLSGQGHWVNPFRPPQPPPMPSHIHVELTGPFYGKLFGDMVMPIQFQIFECPGGHLTNVFSENGDLVLDYYGEWRERIDIPCDPDGHPKILTGKFYFHIAKADGGIRRIVPHGWAHVYVTGVVELASGTKVQEEVAWPFYSVRDVSQPPAPGGPTEGGPDCDDCGPLFRISNSTTSSFDGTNFNGWGESIIRIREKLPLAPLALGTHWQVNVEGYTYAGDATLLPFASGENRFNMNLHAGIPGVVYTGPFTFDTTAVGLGKQKATFIWKTIMPETPPSTYQPNEGTFTLFTWPFEVVTSVAQPTPVPYTRIAPDDFLQPGQSRLSPNGHVAVYYASDNNLMLIRDWTTVLWATYAALGTPPGYAYLQNDGNLVVYNPEWAWKWQSYTSGRPHAFLAIQDDGTLRIYPEGTAPSLEGLGAVWTAP